VRRFVLIRPSLSMPRLSAVPITLTSEQEGDLQRLARAYKTPRKLAERAEMSGGAGGRSHDLDRRNDRRAGAGARRP
jgi:hypothetical protein